MVQLSTDFWNEAHGDNDDDDDEYLSNFLKFRSTVSEKKSKMS